MDFEGEYTMRTASNQQSYEPDTVYPDAVLNIARDSASVFQLKRKWEKTPPMLNLTPDFQRGLVWKPKQKSELIESILMGIPLPLIYVKEDEKGVYVIVDGFHRYRVMLEHPDIYEREQGLLPVSVIDKPLDQRMASTIRHNRARGTHNVDLMSNIIKELHELGRSDAWISKHLGMEKDEILRLKQITGLAALFQEIDFGAAWQPVEEEEEAPPV